jgi:hypothetical protein
VGCTLTARHGWRALRSPQQRSSSFSYPLNSAPLMDAQGAAVATLF